MVQFDENRWQAIKDDYGAWWAGELKRPLLAISIAGNDPGRPEPDLPAHHFTAFYGTDLQPERIVDRWDYNLSCREYQGDAFPSVWPNFGPGAIASFIGCGLRNGVETVWFEPEDELEIRDLRFEFDREAPWFKWIASIAVAADSYWQGSVQLGMNDLGGNLDILSSFLPGEKLLLELYDHPEEVERLTWEAHEVWWAYFDAFNRLMPSNPGYTSWTPIFSEEPYYMLQCDFCYMIGPEMFNRFVRPELAASCRKLVNPFYHLDGPGELPHLDSLLQIPELKGVQWVPGAGAPDIGHWPEVYRKIRDAGKYIQVFTGQYEGGLGIVELLAEQLGSLEGVIFIGDVSKDSADEAKEILRKYGAPVY